MTTEIEELIDNIEILTKKLHKTETYLQGITVGMGIVLTVMVVILVRIIAGG